MLTVLLLFVAVIGYIFSIVKEKMNLFNNQVEIKSDRVTQSVIDDVDMKVFKLGSIKLTIGDEIKIFLKDDRLYKGTVIGAKRKNNALCIVALDDEIVELNVKRIRKLKIVTRYGKLF